MANPPPNEGFQAQSGGKLGSDLAETFVRIAQRTRSPNIFYYMQTKQNHLAEWLSHPQAATLFGHGFRLRLDCLEAIIIGQPTLAAVARKHNVSRAAVSKIAKQQLRIVTPSVDFKLTEPA